MRNLLLAALAWLFLCCAVNAQAVPNVGGMGVPNSPPGISAASPTLTGTTTFSGSPGTLTITPSSTGGTALPTGGGGGSLLYSLPSVDYTTWSGASGLRPFYYYAQLTPSVNATYAWTQFANYTRFSGPGQAQSEINNDISAFVMDSGATSTSQVENHEARLDNSGSLNLFVHYLNLSNNLSTGTVTTFNGMRCGLQNANTTAGSVGTYACLDMEALSGAGTSPTNYYLVRNNEPNATFSTVGNVGIGSLTIYPERLHVQGPDTGSTLAVKVTDSATTIVFDVTDAGDAIISNTLGVGTAGSKQGKIFFKNTTSGNIQLSAPSSGALGTAVATLPVNTGTIAETNFAQSWTATQTMSGAAFVTAGFTVATLPAGVQGARAHVTDAMSCTFLGALTGGGSTFCPVVYNGSAWVGG